MHVCARVHARDMVSGISREANRECNFEIKTFEIFRHINDRRQECRVRQTRFQIVQTRPAGPFHFRILRTIVPVYWKNTELIFDEREWQNCLSELWI